MSTVTAAALALELQKLPLHNETALRVIALLDDPDVEVSELGHLIQSDPGLTTRVLKLANSTFFGRRSEVTAIDKAIVAVGFSTVRTFALAAAFDLFSDKGSPLPPNFWHHAISSAAGATVVARRVRLSPGDAFSAGLIHDLGIALLHRHDTARYEARCIAPGLTEDEVVKVERELFGMDHAAAAAMTLAEVRFPKLLVDAVADHHAPVRKRRLGRPELGAVVAIGQLIGDQLDPSGRLTQHADLGEWLGQIGIDASPSSILAELSGTFEDITGFIAM